MIDRTTPSVRPVGRSSGTQTWRSLLFCHWEVPCNALRNCVPSDLEIDTFDGRAFIGVVPFKMRAIRPRWLPQALALNFLETNVRTYVIHKGRPGVYFFSLEASSRLAVRAARMGWSLPYHHARMQSSQIDDQFTYTSSRTGSQPRRHQTSFRIGQELGPVCLGTLEHFLLERYLLFTRKRGHIYVGQVHHQPYPLWTAIIDDVQDQLVAAAGLPPVTDLPDIAHFSPGVDVEVFAIKRDI